MTTRQRSLCRVVWIWVLLAAAVLSPPDGRAEGISLSGDLTYSNFKVDTESKLSQEKTDTDFSALSQLYNLELNKEIFPYLHLRSGTTLHRTTTKTITDDSRSKFSDRTGDYFFELNLDNPVYRAGLTYGDTDGKSDGTNFADRKDFREFYSGFLQWRPDQLPSVDLNYRRLHGRDSPRTREARNEVLNLNSKYYYQKLGFEYTYNRAALDERFVDARQLDQLHDGELSYSTSVLGGRVSVDAGSQLTYRVSDPSRGVSVRLLTPPPLRRYFLIPDSMPENNDEGDFTTVTQVNPLTEVDIGPNPFPEQVSFGVEFSSPTRADVIYVLPRPRLEGPSSLSLASAEEIAAVDDMFDWQVFSSQDQEVWTELDVTGVVYKTFENRFEISFLATEDVRFIKVVTEQLPAGPTGGIEISQLQTLETPGGRAGDKVRSFRQVYDFGLRADLSSDTTATYDLYYKVDELVPGSGRRTWITNGGSLRHEFGPKLVGHTRYLRAITRRRGERDSLRDNFVASLRAQHLDTFYQTLTYSSVYGRDDEPSEHTQSLWLRSSADLHPDWSTSLDVGLLRRSSTEGDPSSGPTIGLISHLRPNRRMNFRFNYSVTWTKEKHETTRRQQQLDFRAHVAPTSAVSLFADISFDDDDIDDHRLSQDYSVRWAPFPDGDLDLSLIYRRFKTRAGRESNTVTPELRLQIRPGLLGILSYTVGREKSKTEKRALATFRAELQFSFR